MIYMLQLGIIVGLSLIFCAFFVFYKFYRMHKNDDNKQDDFGYLEIMMEGEVKT